jgi:hypothetical protein
VYEGLFPWVRVQSVNRTVHIRTSTVEAKNAWGFTYIPTHVFVAQCSRTGLHMDTYFLHIFKQTPQPSVSADRNTAVSFSTTSRQTVSISHYAIRTDRKGLQAYTSDSTNTIAVLPYNVRINAFVCY